MAVFMNITKKVILMKNLGISKRTFLKGLLILKGLFFHNVKTFEEDILKLYKTAPENTHNQEQIIILLHNDFS